MNPGSTRPIGQLAYNVNIEGFENSKPFAVLAGRSKTQLEHTARAHSLCSEPPEPKSVDRRMVKWPLSRTFTERCAHLSSEKSCITIGQANPRWSTAWTIVNSTISLSISTANSNEIFSASVVAYCVGSYWGLHTVHYRRSAVYSSV